MTLSSITLRLALLMAFILPISSMDAQTIPKEYPNNAYHVLHFLVIQDSNIKKIVARNNETLTDRLYGYELDLYNANKITFYRNQVIRKMKAPEGQLLSGVFEDSRFGVLDLAQLNVYMAVFDKSGNIVSLHTYEDDIVDGQVGPYILSTFDSHHIGFKPDGTLFLPSQK